MDNTQNTDVHEQKVQTLIKRKDFSLPVFFINIDWGEEKTGIDKQEMMVTEYL